MKSIKSIKDLEDSNIRGRNKDLEISKGRKLIKRWKNLIEINKNKANNPSLHRLLRADAKKSIAEYKENIATWEARIDKLKRMGGKN